MRRLLTRRWLGTTWTGTSTSGRSSDGRVKPPRSTGTLFMRWWRSLSLPTFAPIYWAKYRFSRLSLMIMDRNTRWFEAVELENINSTTLPRSSCRFGCPGTVAWSQLWLTVVLNSLEMCGRECVPSYTLTTGQRHPILQRQQPSGTFPQVV